MGKLDQLITRLKRTPMNVGTLKKLLPDHASFKVLDELKAHRSKVFGKNKCIVVLIPSKFTDVGHFVVLTRFPKYVEYFSSFGGAPAKELDKLGQHSVVLKELLGKNFVYNSVQLQRSSKSINDCALFVLARVALRDLKLREFQELFKGRVCLQSADEIVAMLCALLLVDN